MAQSTFDGPVISKTGIYHTGPGAVVNITAPTTLTVAAHAGRIIRVNDADCVITLPTINASADNAVAGPGADPNNPSNVGAEFFIVIETTATNLDIVTDGTDKYVGSLAIFATDASGAVTAYAPAASNDTITLNGTTTGGVAGSWIRITALASLKYQVTGLLNGSGAVATPFADA